MKKFNMSRFGNLLKLDLTRNKHTYVHALLGMLVGFLLLQFMAYYNIFKGFYYTPVQLQSAYDNVYVMFMLVESLLALLFISSTFTFLNDKARRISYFLLPATNLEKFLSRITLYTLGMFVLSLAAYVLADLVVVGVMSIFYPHTASAMPHVFNECIGFFSHSYDLMFDHGSFVYGGFVTVISMISFSCMLLSLYLFASMIFRKHPFILMSCCVICFVVLLTMFFMEEFSGSYSFIVLRNDGYMSLLFIGLTVVFTGLSYCLFKRKGAANQSFF